MEIVKIITGFIEKRFMRDAANTPTATDSLLDSGILDSAGIFELVSFMEKEFKIEIGDDDIVPDHFENIECIATLIRTRQG
ncbi:MAG: acyl carrier protein [Gammaproteobacteria bacterium]|nr:acyl carrier protein [Gammaproteobacteria bacterium]